MEKKPMDRVYFPKLTLPNNQTNTNRGWLTSTSAAQFASGPSSSSASARVASSPSVLQSADPARGSVLTALSLKVTTKDVRASAPNKKIKAGALNYSPQDRINLNLNELYVPQEPNQLMSSDKHDLIVRVFNFYRETNHRFRSTLQNQHDEDLLNRLILQCIGTTCRLSSWNRPSIYLSPYTPIKPSKMHISELDENSIILLVEQFKSLQELVDKAFVCPKWVPPVAKVISGRTHSLKVFDFEGNVELYKESALMQYNLARLDLAAVVHQTGDKNEDHIFTQFFRDEENNLVKDIIEDLFAKVTYLVLHTLNIDQARLIRSLYSLTSVTLFDPPDSNKQQNAIWEALNAAPELRHVHIFYINGEIPFEADKMDFLTQIESFTLDNYKPDNLFAIFNRLSPELRCLQIGPFAQGDEVLERLIKENPGMVANLTQLSVCLDEKSMEKSNELYEESYLIHKRMLELIVDYLTKLAYLDLEFASLMFYNEVIGSLSKLPNLTELRFASRSNDDTSSFLGWPTQTELIGFPNRRRQPTPLPNISKVYLVINNPYDDNPFLSRLFADDQVQGVRMQPIQAAWMQRNANANVAHVFPGIEQATFVLNSNNLSSSGNFLLIFRESMRRTIPPQYWLRLQLYNVAVGTINDRFFARNEDDVERSIRERKAANAAALSARDRVIRVNQGEPLRIVGLGDNDAMDIFQAHARYVQRRDNPRQAVPWNPDAMEQFNEVINLEPIGPLEI